MPVDYSLDLLHTGRTDGIGITVAHGYDTDGGLVVTCTQDLFARVAGH